MKQRVNQSVPVAESVLLAALAEVFFGATPAAVAQPPLSPSGGDIIVATIGFGGAEMRGAITLMAPISSWWTLGPATMGVGADTEAMLCDMVGELTNMLAARLRNGFLRMGVEILIATPVTTFGGCRAVHPSDTISVRWHEVTADDGDFRLRFDVSFVEGFDFAGRDVAAITPNEQELVFF